MSVKKKKKTYQCFQTPILPIDHRDQQLRGASDRYSEVSAKLSQMCLPKNEISIKILSKCVLTNRTNQRSHIIECDHHYRAENTRGQQTTAESKQKANRKQRKTHGRQIDKNRRNTDNNGQHHIEAENKKKPSENSRKLVENKRRTNRKQTENIGKEMENCLTTMEVTQTTDTLLSHLDTVK